MEVSIHSTAMAILLTPESMARVILNWTISRVERLHGCVVVDTASDLPTKARASSR